MALTSVRSLSSLEPVAVLAPERYDPRRAMGGDHRDSVPLGTLARVERRTIQPSSSLGACFVLDTSDAREGIIVGRKRPVDGSLIGSAKKVIASGDVIISRLRPYLRQVAWVDNAIPHADSTTLVCSTEFFVLRGRDERSIAFLVPILLSAAVQKVLCASQEGGHHPRFEESMLTGLPIPNEFLDERERWSNVTTTSVKLYRESEAAIDRLVSAAGDMFGEIAAGSGYGEGGDHGLL